MAWTVLWILLAADSPSQHRRITHAERSYIEKNLASSKGDPEDRSDDEVCCADSWCVLTLAALGM